MWLACNGVRYVANVEDDSLLYNVFAGIIVSMAIVSGVAMVIGQVIIGKFVKRIEQDRLAKEQMSRAMYHGIATPIIDLRDQVDMFRLGYCGKEEMCDFVAKNCESLLRLVKTKSTISMNRGRVSLSKPEALDLSREVRKTTESYLYAIAVPFYGGEIKCKSKVGAGTEFTVTLPLRSRYTAGWVSGGCVGLLPQRFGSSAPCHGSYRPCWG